METSAQFQQLHLFGHEPEPKSVVRNRSVPVGGQLELPMGDLSEKHMAPAGPAPVDKQRELLKGKHPVDVYHGGTYPMFLSGPEIRQQYQGLDGDRHSGLPPQWRQPGKLQVRATHTATHAQWAEGNSGSGRYVREGDRVPSRTYDAARFPSETDDEMFERKYEEAEHEEDPYAHGSGVSDNIHDYGYDWSRPVHLSNGFGFGSEGGRRGQLGKYQILGAHHRVAVMAQDFPRQFMPVVHADDFSTARDMRDY